MSSSYREALKILRKYNVETDYIYGSKLYTTSMFISYFYNHLSFVDISKFLKSMYSLDKEDKRVLREWIEDNNISEEGSKALCKLAISLATNENEMLAYIFFKTIKEGQGSSLIQSKDNDLWIMRWERELSQRDNVKIFKNSKLLELKSENGNIIEAETSLQICKADVYICAIPLYPLKTLVDKCSVDIQSNWMDKSRFSQYCIQSSYSGLGFQLHFTEELKPINMWKTKSFSDWNIEVLNINNYSDYTKNLAGEIIFDENYMPSLSSTILSFNKNSGSNNFSKLIVEFGLIPILGLFLIFIFSFRKEINEPIKATLIPLIFIQCFIRGTGYFDSGFIISLIIVLVLISEQVIKKYENKNIK